MSLLLGCTRDLHGTQHLSVQDHAKQFALVPYGGDWEFRYGDSPRDASGAFLFADPRHTDEHWRKTNTIYQPPGRGNQRFLWLRTRLQGPPLSDPALFLQSVNQSFQAFLDGQLIAEFGAMEGPAALRFPGEPRTYLPLLPPPSSQLDSVSAHRYVGRTLVLRVFSPHRYIGVFGELLLGARSTLIADQVQRGASAFVIGLIMIGIGLLALVLFALRFSEHVYFYYGGFALSAGSHFLARSSLHELIVHDPALWGLLVVLTEPLVAVFLAAFVWKTLGRGPLGVMPKLALGYLAMFVICVALILSGTVNLWDLLLPIQLSMLGGIIGLVTTLLLAAWKGDTGARILCIGFVICASGTAFDIFAAMGLIGGSHHIFSHYGTAGLVMSLGAVLAWRFVGIALMTDRAARLERESALQQQRLSEQSRLLTAAGRMAKGDLVSKIAVPEGSELAPLAGALDSMREDLQQKLAQLQQRNAEIHGLNDELRRQIEQRSRRLMEAVARSFGSDSVSAQPATVTVGKRLGDHYQVLAALGRGAMGAVFEVERVTDHRHFAAKILTEARKKTSLLRFAREAQILCRLDHPNLISIVDIDVTKDGVVFLVMELVRGTVLKLRQDRFREVRFAIDVLRQMSAGLAAIHRAGIVHRDLKPANVLLTEAADGKVTVKLADFGISILSQEVQAARSGDGGESLSDSARMMPLHHDVLDDDDSDYAAYRVGSEASSAAAVDDTGLAGAADTAAASTAADVQLTATGVLVGTPMYMAPELADGSRNARSSADLFALGVIAYELLTGEMPYSAPVVWAKKPREVRMSAPPLRERGLALPESLLTMLDRCLHRDPVMRPTAESLHAALSACQREESPS
jgi:serine/threonine protein kinase